jgi:hypothetical protein
MLERRLFVIHWICFIFVIILILVTIAQIITSTFLEPNLNMVSPQMIDEAALQIILYFLLLPLFTLTYWLIKRTWVFFPWQQNKAKN